MQPDILFSLWSFERGRVKEKKEARKKSFQGAIRYEDVCTKIRC